MTFQLDEATLAAMVQEAKACFLDEDAPEYLQALEEGVQQRHDSPDFTSLLRAAHSLKGGAGLANLEDLRELAHKLEDLMLAIQQGQLSSLEDGWAVLEWGVNEVAIMLSQARTSEVVTADPNLLEALAIMASSGQPEEETPQQSDEPINPLVEKALRQDLEGCFLRIEELSANDEPEVLKDCLEMFFDECLLLGETLELSWLVAGIEPLEAFLDDPSPEKGLAFAKNAIAHLRSQRDEYLAEKAVVSSQSPLPPLERGEKEGIQESEVRIEESGVEDTQEKAEEKEQEGELRIPKLSQLRIPLKRLEKMTNHVEELILTQERLRLQQNLLEQANRQLRQLTRQFEPIRDQVQAVYDQLAIAPLQASTSSTFGVTSNSSTAEFDVMELDRYTDLHSSLQLFQELMLRVQETRSDLDLVNRDLSEDLVQVQSNLDELYNDVTQSRLVPFRLLGKRFVPQLQLLNRRYGKSVDLVVEGEDALVDQVLLEQLQTPLTHLLNNAFDHGIETASERFAVQKPEKAQILLKAKIENNQLLISLSDDGRGIDLDRVYQRALERGLCSPEIPFEQYHPQQILDWIFQPGFSTAHTVSELSGRGVGLDIVRTQIQRLRGIIQVDTHLGEGTTFTLKLPLNLSLLSLSLIQLERRIIALPSTSVLETLLYTELEWVENDSPTIHWHQQNIPVVPLSSLLPCPRMPMESTNPRVGMVLAGASGPFVVLVNAMISERQLIVKPFDDTVIAPPYLAGCTILGSGEVVPVILPQGFEMRSHSIGSQPILPTTSTAAKSMTVLVAEDSVATRRLLEKLLTQVGYTVIVARDGQEALDELYQRRGQVDLVVSDVEMPRLNGFDLLQKLRSNWTGIPVIMVTSRTGERHREQAMQLGANGYLGKPIQFQELIATIEDLLTVHSSVV